MKSIKELKQTPPEKMTMEDAQRIADAERKKNNGKLIPGGFAERAMKAAKKNIKTKKNG